MLSAQTYYLYVYGCSQIRRNVGNPISTALNSEAHMLCRFEERAKQVVRGRLSRLRMYEPFPDDRLVFPMTVPVKVVALRDLWKSSSHAANWFDLESTCCKQHC